MRIYPHDDHDRQSGMCSRGAYAEFPSRVPPNQVEGHVMGYDGTSGERSVGAPGMAVEPEAEMVVLLEGVVDVLGVIVGPSRLHMPAESGHLKAVRQDRRQPAIALCGKTFGRVRARYDAPEAPMCRNCTRIAANAIRAGER